MAIHPQYELARFDGKKRRNNFLKNNNSMFLARFWEVWTYLAIKNV